MLVAGVMVSCEDYLTVLPTGSIPEENFWESKADIHAVRAAAYYQMTKSSVTSRLLYWGELRSDNVERKQADEPLRNLMEGILQPTQGMFQWGDFYSGISYCNKVIENGDRMIAKDIDPTFAPGEWLPIKAEMLGLRALYYFDLVRAFRDVPYVDHTISTDAEALAARKGQVAEYGIVILDSLINQLEDCQRYAATNYGVNNTAENKGRFTKQSIRMLLADIYLWQGCMMKKYFNKNYKIHVNAPGYPANAESDEDIPNYYLQDRVTGDSLKTQAQVDAVINRNFARAVELCDGIMHEMDSVYREDQTKYPTRYTTKELTQPYPLTRIRYATAQNVDDGIYSTVWGRGNSDESIFELQYEGSGDSKNTVYSDIFYNTSNKSAQKVSARSRLFQLSQEDQEGTLEGFGKYDFRALETASLPTASASEYPIVKNSISSLNISDLQDMSEGADITPRGSQDAAWPVYRLADLMLIKAECLARLEPDAASDNIKEGYNLVNQLFERCNPILYTEGAENPVTLNRMSETFADGKNGNALLGLILRERQREFFAEGKRWFDLVRQAEWDNSTSDVLANHMKASKSVQTRLRKMAAMYVPYYNDELKVNPYLRQNEVWDQNTPNSSKPIDKKNN